MIKVEDFRAFDLYDRSVDLTIAISQAIKVCQGNLLEKEIEVIRKKAVIVPSKIAAAISQVNFKVRFKKLNEAKGILIQLKSIMFELTKRKKIDESSWQTVNSCSIDVMKLINGYFRWLGNGNAS